MPSLGVNHQLERVLFLMQTVHQGKGIGHMNIVINGPMNEKHLPY